MPPIAPCAAQGSRRIALFATVMLIAGAGLSLASRAAEAFTLVPNQISIGDRTLTEGNSGTLNFNFTVTLTRFNCGGFTINYYTSDGTASQPEDYAERTGTLTFAASCTTPVTQTITVPVVGDLVAEPDETFSVYLWGVSPEGITNIVDGTGVGTILNGDGAPPTVSVGTTSVIEGSGAGSTNMVFTLQLSSASNLPVTVGWTTQNGTAAPGSDYTTTRGDTVFNPGQTSRTVSIPVVRDTSDEADETFILDLLNVSNGVIGQENGVGLIRDDDGPALNIANATVTEGNSGSVSANFVVSLTSSTQQTVTVDYATSNGTATAGTDYSNTTGTLTFVPGDTSETISVSVLGDLLDEPNENFAVTLSSPVQASISDGNATGTITDNDDPPKVTINTPAVTETTGAPTSLTFTVSLTQASGRTVEVDWATDDGTAVAPADYQSGSDTLTFTPGTTSQPIVVTVVGDAIDEPAETLVVDLSNPVNATLSDIQGTGTINDNDPVPTLSIDNVEVSEADAGGTSTATFTVSLSQASGRTVEVDWATEDDTAAEGTDYDTDGGTIAFSPGTTSQTVEVTILGDALDEDDETFLVNLSNAFNANFGDVAFGVGKILDNDATPTLSINNVSVTEGDTGETVTASFTVTLSAASGRTVSVRRGTGNNTAVAPGDYTALSNATLTFNPGVVTRTINVTVQGDALDEANETFFVNLGNPSNVIISDGQGLGTITDDDDLPALSINDVAVTEGNTGSVLATYTVSLSAPSGRTVTVNAATRDDTAVSPDDYAAIEELTLSFDPGETTQTVDVTVFGDLLDEDDETYELHLGTAGNATIADGIGVGSIGDNDDLPALSIDSVAVVEGDAGSSTTATFRVTLTAASGRTVTVSARTNNISAVAPVDYTALAPTTITFPPGETKVAIDIEVQGDDRDEFDEIYHVVLSSPVNVTIADGQGQGTITDDDAAPDLSIDDVAVTEGDEGSAGAVFTVSLSAPSGRAVSVTAATADDTAAAGADYAGLPPGTSLTFGPGETTQTVRVDVLGDLLDEDDEHFAVNLSGASHAGIADGEGMGTIEDDDATPSLSIGDVTVTEGNAGTALANFTVTLSAPSGRSVEVTAATADDTAEAPGDYTAVEATTLVFDPGVTARIFSVPVVGDATDEPLETFVVDLSNALNATIEDAQAIGTITDDDGAPSLSINDVTVTEGNAGTATATFTVTLSPASGQTVTVLRATADGSATSPGDYAALGSATLTFDPGETTQTIAVTVQADLLDEIDETFTVSLSGAVNAAIIDAQGLGTITDDDATPTLSIDDVVVDEGNSGTATATFTVSLSAASGRTVTVSRATADGSAVSPADYTALGAALLTFDPGTTSRNVAVTVHGDLLDEIDEAFEVNLSGVTNATILDGQGIGTITDDDALPSLSIADVEVTEGNTGTVSATFTVTLSAPSGRTVTVTRSTADDTATAPADYAALGPATLTFVPGDTSETFDVLVQGDVLDEDDETFDVLLAEAVNATLADDTAIATIADDDATPTLSINDATVTEGATGTTTTATFTVTLSAASGRTVTVSRATADDSAAAPADYTALPGEVLTFAPGITTQTVAVTVQGDALDEIDEVFRVNLSSPNNATIADGQGTGTITDDDATPTLSIDDATVTEGNSGSSVNVSFTVTLSAASGQTVTVRRATADDTAVAPADYTALADAMLTFTPGTTTQTITVAVQGDDLDEIDETFLVDLSSPVNATLADGEGLGTITDDDATPTLSIGDAGVTEGDAGTTTATFTVTLSAPSGQTVTVSRATANDTAQAPDDYASLSAATLTFAPGTTSQTVDVTVRGDALDEADEVFFVNLTSPSNATVADGQGAGTIGDDDATPTLAVDDVTVTEPDSGETALATFTVSLSAPSGRTVTVDRSTSADTATAPADFTALAEGTLTFDPGATTQTFDVIVQGDLLDEIDETFFAELVDPVHATLADAQGVGTIADDDPTPSLSIDDVVALEGDSGSSTATFTVTLSEPSGRTVEVGWSTTDDSAAGSADFTAGAGTLSFDPGTTSRTITIDVLGDLLDEQDETWFLDLSSPTNATLSSSRGTGTITDDDETPSLSIGDVIVDEGDETATFTVTLSAPSGQPVGVTIFSADETAIAPDDYAAVAPMILAFDAGVTTQTVDVAVVGDALDEIDEVYSLNLVSPSNATLADDRAIGTITDDDELPVASIADAQITEADDEAVTLTFTVALSAPSGRALSVDFATADGSALAGVDYLAAAGTLTLAAGETAGTIDIVVAADLEDEPNETIALTLTNPVAVALGDAEATGTILDNDGPAALTITGTSVTEGDAGSTAIQLEVTLAPPSGLTVTVDYATQAGGALAEADFTSATGTLTFEPGTTSRTLEIEVLADLLDEADETFSVSLAEPENAEIEAATATVTILDDDELPAISVADVSLPEGPQEVTTPAIFTLTLTPVSGRPVTVSYATTGDTAVSGEDFLAASGTVTFAAGTASQTVTVSIVGDTAVEPDEGFDFKLADPDFATLADGTARGTIVDDDATPDLTVAITAPADWAVGGERTYQLQVSNVGTRATSAEIALTHALPPGLVFGSASGTDWSCAVAEGVLDCLTSSPVAPAASLADVAVVVEVEPGAYPDVDLTAAVSTAGDVNGSNNGITVTRAVVGLADVSVAKANEGDGALPGEGIEYLITVTNHGPNVVDAVELTELMPEELLSPAFTPAEGEYDAETGLWTGLAIDVDESVTLQVAATVSEDASGTLTNTVEVAVLASLVDPDLDDNTADDVSVVQDPGACDDDGLPDDVEEELGTDPCLADSDGDGLLDGIEVDSERATDPRASDSDGDGLCDGPIDVAGECVAGEDLDADGLLDLGETDPTLEDTDGDGLGDHLELFAENATDPTLADTDVDGLCDGPSSRLPTCASGEDLNANGRIDEGETDPNNPDSDADGLPDGIERTGDNPTDPLDPDTDRDLLCDGPATVADVCTGGEDINRSGSVDVTETDPNDPDSDRGGVPDGQEVLGGTNPLAPVDDAFEREDEVDEGCGCRSGGPEAAVGLLGLLSVLVVSSLRGRRRYSLR